MLLPGGPPNLERLRSNSNYDPAKRAERKFHELLPQIARTHKDTRSTEASMVSDFNHRHADSVCSGGGRGLGIPVVSDDRRGSMSY